MGEVRKDRPREGDAARRLTYADAGVDVEAAARLVGGIAAHAARTRRPEVLGGVGGFGGLFALDKQRYDEPVLVAGADGVGTKLQLAFALDRHGTVGQDCVAMCVNDIVVQGAEPLFFLDYIGIGRLDPRVVEELVAGVADGCRRAGCALLGGETAEMPGSYPPGEYDIAGFAVGAVERADVVDGRGVRPGDRLVGLASDGVHSNGYSLVRRMLLSEGEGAEPGFDCGLSGDRPGGGAPEAEAVPGRREARRRRLRAALTEKPRELGGLTLGEELLKPTRIYVAAVRSLLALGFDVRAMAHVTGGGLTENVPRSLPAGLGARLHPDRWTRPAVFDWLRRRGPVDDGEMRRTFNDGVGFVLVVPEPEAAALVEAATELGETAWIIGEVVTEEEIRAASEAGASAAGGPKTGPPGGRVVYS